MRDRRTALLWTIGWWFARRYLRRRAALAVAGVATAAATRRSRLLRVTGAFVLVGLLAVAFVAWRKLFAQADASDEIPSPTPRAEREAIAPDGADAAAGDAA
jgi:hypothetical protein